MAKIGNYTISGLKTEGNKTVTYTSDVPGENPAVGRIPVNKNLLGVNLTIDVFSDVDTGDPGYTGFGGDYDVKIHCLTPIRRMRIGTGAVKNDVVANVRSDAMYLAMDAVFSPAAAVLPTLAVAATGAAAHYFVNLHLPIRINKSDHSDYWYEFDMSTEAEWITTVANQTMTSVEFRFQNVYTNDTVQTVYWTDANSGAIDSASGASMGDGQGFTHGMTLMGLVISGEQAGTEDLVRVIIEDHGKTIYDEDIDDHWRTIGINTYGKINRTDFKNVMIIVFEPFVVGATSKLKIATSASQDYQLTYIRADAP